MTAHILLIFKIYFQVQCKEGPQIVTPKLIQVNQQLIAVSWLVLPINSAVSAIHSQTQQKQNLYLREVKDM
jgi:hypothetical protein